MEVDRDFMVIAQPCGPWSQMQQMNQRTPHQIRRLMRKRQQHRSLLVFVEELVHWQAARRRAVVSESPVRALSWLEPPLQAAFSRPDMGAKVLDMCCFNKRRPDNNMLVRKTTMVKGTPEVCNAVEGRCCGGHKHSPIQGTVRVPEGNRWKTMRMSEWAGGYTKEFAYQLLGGAEVYLREQWPDGAISIQEDLK